MTEQKDLVRTAIDFVDAIVEVYLKFAIQPFLQLHEKFYTGLNKVLRQILDDADTLVPRWLTANFITYLRTLLVIPAVILLSRGHTVIPALTVIVVDCGDFLDGVVARYWVDVNNNRKKEEAGKSESSPRAESPASSSEEDSFEVVTTGSPHSLPSWVQLLRNRNYGGFIDAVCDKAFIIPCWIALLPLVSVATYFVWLQYATLMILLLAETASGCVRFQAYYTAGGVPSPTVVGLDFSTSAVKADHIGKAKQTFEMVGTALFMLVFTRYIGLVLLLLAVPLAYESVRRKVVQRTIYVVAISSDKNYVDHKTLKFWMQAASMGSKLVVGVPSSPTVASGSSCSSVDTVLTARAVSCVHTVIAEAPDKADLMFLEKLQIDYVVMPPGTHQVTKFVTDEVVNAKRVLAIGDDGVARLVESKVEGKKE